MRIFALLLLLLNLGYLAWHFLPQNRDAPAALVRSPARDAPQRLILLSEREGGAAIDAPRCLELGVFPSAGDSARFIEGAEALGLEAGLQPVEVMETPDYWVHMPPLVSEAAALRRLEELKGKNIESYLITGGELDRGISLGLFSRREFALRLQEQLAGQGYASEIREVPRAYTELWVTVSSLPRGGRALREWNDFLAQWPALRQVEKLCETIARQP